MVTTRRNSDDDVPNFEAMITAVVANALPNLTAALRTQITNDIRNGGGDAVPHGIHVWIESYFKFWVVPTTSRMGLAAFKLEGDALSWWKAHFAYSGLEAMLLHVLVLGAFREIVFNRYFPASEQQRYEREYGSICQLDRENSGEYMERFTRLASFVGATAGDAQRQARHFKWGLKKWVLDRIVNTDLYECFAQDQSVEHRGRQDRGYDSKRQDFRGQDQRFTGRNGNDRQGQGNYNQRQHRNQSTRDFNQGHTSGSAGQRMSTETLPPPPLCTTCGKPHPDVCYKATVGCFTCGLVLTI
ncbi:hypothetical protein Tco_1203092 [Tanacetum coccineum]